MDLPLTMLEDFSKKSDKIEIFEFVQNDLFGCSVLYLMHAPLLIQS